MIPTILAQAGPEAYMPHGMCYLWQQDLVWLHVVSDSLTALAYWAIPPFLVYLAVRARHEIPSSAPYARRRLPYDWMFLAFGVFIVACGATHAMGIWTIWEPRYWLEGGVKAVTAVASVATAVALPPLIPRALEVIREARESEVRRVELEEAHREQEDLVGRLKEAGEARARFLASVSHDLRTPLSLILGPVSEVLREGELSGEARDRLRTAVRNARTLGGQVENLLAVARIETGGLEAEPRPVDLATVLREAAANYEGHARGREMTLEVDAPESLVAAADGDLVERALLNLLSNAFKFTPDGGSVRCTLRRTEDGVEVVVADSGPGVPEEEREAVFGRFSRGADAAHRQDGGTGLGLAIVREVAEAHRGSVELARSGELGGARVTLRLAAPCDAAGDTVPTASPAGGDRARSGPAGTGGAGGSSSSGPVPREEPPHPAEEGKTPDPDGIRTGAEGGSRPTVLVVEDDADMARYLGRVLSPDHRVAYAADGRQGLQRATELRPDLVLADLMMPEMGGAELVEAIRERPELSATPILVLTAKADEELPERLLRGGAQDYVLKPVREGELRARIGNLLELTRSRRLLQGSLASEEDSLEELARTAADRKAELERTVEEKEVLMRELHHRVKGNLQTVSSLLQLQLRSVDDERARRTLEESRGRVVTMGILHEKLYRSGVPERVELSGYLRSLVADLLRSRGAGDEIRTTLALEEVDVAVDDAVACGLVVHELVTNALRHAFPSGRGGTIRVALVRGDGRATLVVADDGRGGRDDADEEGLGLALVESLVDQLEGRLRTERDDGTRVEIVFPVSPEDERRRAHLEAGGDPES